MGAAMNRRSKVSIDMPPVRVEGKMTGVEAARFVKAWDGNGRTPAGLTLTDSEVLVLMRAGTISIPAGSPDQLPALRVWQRLQRRAEDILNEQRATRR